MKIKLKHMYTISRISRIERKPEIIPGIKIKKKKHNENQRGIRLSESQGCYGFRF